MSASAHGVPGTTGKQRAWMMTAICLSAFLSHFTAGVVNVSLPRFITVFQSDIGTVQWMTTGYLLAITSLLPLMGKLGDRWGHRLIHNWGIALFTISSVLVALSPNLAVLLGMRIMQATGAAMFQATNMALITFHMPGAHRGRALGFVSTAVALGGMAGPVAGSFTAAWLSWQWAFLIHVPVALLATGLALRFIPADQKEEKRNSSLDLVGAILFMGGIGSGIYAIVNGGALGWGSPSMLMLYVVLLIVWPLSWLWQSRQEEPFLPLAAFRIPAVACGLLISCASFLLANIALVLMPFYISEITAVSAADIGYVMLAYPLLLAVIGPIAGHLSDRIGSRRLMCLGLCAMAGGFMLFSGSFGELPLWGIICTLALIGAGMGLIASPNNSFIMSYAMKDDAGSIGSMIALTRNVGLVLGAALGLGLMDDGDPAKPIEAYLNIFGLGAWIGAASLLPLGYSWYAGRRMMKRRHGVSAEK
ncbi:MFS transporter [Paenibacillus dendritiformis]|uniref:MFS transporter n=1 Tax=Paenibacillus dendritiformis TaxID=130049 RepID=UPI00248ADE8C|nr:MFS transporter [Paenibacillus dendritiformis]WGU95818.1 MFS transporter [Paenibacillus dendritiformis]